MDNTGYMIRISATSLYMTRVALVGDGKQSSGIQSGIASNSAQGVARRIYAHGTCCVHYSATSVLQTTCMYANSALLVLQVATCNACYRLRIRSVQRGRAGTDGAAVLV